MRVRAVHGDMLEVLPTLEAESFDAVVTDAPYHLSSIVKRFGAPNAAPAKGGIYARSSKGFMQKTWDGGDIAFRSGTWSEVIRVLKPGGYMLCFASARGYHRIVCAIEDAGFIIHPMLGWIFASGFPKAHRVEAEGWEGWRYGLQSLKPALEPICLAQRPMSEKTGTANVLRHGTGALNIDGCRVATSEKLGGGDQRSATKTKVEGWDRPWMHDKAAKAAHAERVNANVAKAESLGRWPSNLAHDSSEEVLESFAAFGESKAPNGRPNCAGRLYDADGRRVLGADVARPYAGGFQDTGTAARYFFSAKADKDDRAGSVHPTVKPLALIRWLVRLITPPGGTVLDPFAGTGVTGEACLREGFGAVLVEREAEYHADCLRRIGRMSGADTPLFASAAE